jgi:hypothetical protein
VENNAVRRADPQRGRFRTFLLASARNFLADEWPRNQAAKRGAGQILFSLDEGTAEFISSSTGNGFRMTLRPRLI